jgi:hypothetical protein
MVMMKAKKSPSPSEEGDQYGLEILVYDGDGAQVHQKLYASRNRVFPHI